MLVGDYSFILSKLSISSERKERMFGEGFIRLTPSVVKLSVASLPETYCYTISSLTNVFIESSAFLF